MLNYLGSHRWKRRLQTHQSLEMRETVEKLSVPASNKKSGSIDHFFSCSTGWAFPRHPKSLEAGIRFLEISSAIKPEPGYPFEFGSSFAR